MWRNTNWYQRVNITQNKTKIVVVRPPSHTGQLFFASEQYKLVDGKVIYRTEQNHGVFCKRFMPEKYSRYFGQVISVDFKMYQDITEYEMYGAGFEDKEGFEENFKRLYPHADQMSFCWMIKYRRLDKQRAYSLEERKLENVHS